MKGWTILIIKSIYVDAIVYQEFYDFILSLYGGKVKQVSITESCFSPSELQAITERW